MDYLEKLFATHKKTANDAERKGGRPPPSRNIRKNF